MGERAAEWDEAIDAWVLLMSAAGRSPETRRLRRNALRRFATWVAPVGPWDATNAQLVAYAGSQTQWGQESRRAFRATARGFYTWAVASGRTTTNPSMLLPSLRQPTPNPRPTPQHALDQALEIADCRTQLMVRLAAELGMRRSEVAQLHTTDLERDLVGWTLIVHGKGSKVRSVPIEPALAAAIRLAAPAGRDGFVFPGNDHGHLSANWVGKLVARVLPEGWAMHSLRHRFATMAYSFERDTFAVQELLGHASPATTRRYVRVPNESLRRTVAAVARAS